MIFNTVNALLSHLKDNTCPDTLVLLSIPQLNMRLNEVLKALVQAGADKTLKRLMISECRLESTAHKPLDLSALSALEFLDLSYNHLRHAPDISKHKHLLSLNLKHNLLSKAAVVSESLKTLELCDNGWLLHLDLTHAQEIQQLSVPSLATTREIQDYQGIHAPFSKSCVLKKPPTTLIPSLTPVIEPMAFFDTDPSHYADALIQSMNLSTDLKHDDPNEYETIEDDNELSIYESLKIEEWICNTLKEAKKDKIPQKLLDFTEQRIEQIGRQLKALGSPVVSTSSTTPPLTRELGQRSLLPSAVLKQRHAREDSLSDEAPLPSTRRPVSVASGDFSGPNPSIQPMPTSTSLPAIADRFLNLRATTSFPSMSVVQPAFDPRTSGRPLRQEVRREQPADLSLVQANTFLPLSSSLQSRQPSSNPMNIRLAPINTSTVSPLGAPITRGQNANGQSSTGLRLTMVGAPNLKYK